MFVEFVARQAARFFHNNSGSSFMGFLFQITAENRIMRPIRRRGNTDTNDFFPIL